MRVFRSRPNVPTSLRKVRRLLGCADGNMALMAALGIFGVSAITGGAITLGEFSSVSRELRDRADALALSASLAVTEGGGEPAVSTQADLALAEVKRGVRGSGHAGVEIVSTETAEVVATLSRDVRLLFGGLLGMDSIRLERSARAIAGGGEPVCLHILSEDQPEAFSRRGASALEANSCIAQVNSSSRRALDSRGAAGGVTTLRTQVRAGSGTADGFSPAPEYGARAIVDPLASKLDWPSAASCSFSGLGITGSARTIAPGVICGDLDLQGGAEAVLSPGVHVITGSLKMGAGAKLKAEGAVLVFVGETSRIEISAQSEARLVAPADGPWKGIAVAVKPQASELASSIHGGGGIDLTGVLYLPSQRLHLTGGGRLAEPTEDLRMIVVNRLDLNGNGRVWLNGKGSPVRASGGVRLIE